LIIDPLQCDKFVYNFTFAFPFRLINGSAPKRHRTHRSGLRWWPSDSYRVQTGHRRSRAFVLRLI